MNVSVHLTSSLLRPPATCCSVLEQVQIYNPPQINTRTHSFITTTEGWWCSAAAVGTKVCRWAVAEMGHTHTQRMRFLKRHEAHTALVYIHSCLSAVPDLTRSDVIGDGGFVYHIWQDSDTAPNGNWTRAAVIQKSLPPGALQTKRVPTGVVVKNKPWLNVLER